MNGFEIPEINNEVKISQEEWNKFQEDLRIAKFKLQEINDNLEGGLTSRNLASFRNTYVFNESDSLDADYPFEMDFAIIPETIKIVKVEVSFKIKKFRAYSKAGAATGTPSGGGSTTPSGGGATSGSGGGQTSSATGTPSGGGSTSGATGSASGGGSTSGGEASNYSSFYGINTYSSVTNVGDENVSGALPTAVQLRTPSDRFHSHTTPAHTHPNHTHSTPNHTHPNHTHTVANHTHSTPNHTHSTPDHTHPNHTHTADYGIFEEETSPTIHFYISEDPAGMWKGKHGGYTEDQTNLDITSYLTAGNGEKMLRFTSDVRCRISARILLKLDIKAR